MPGVLSPTTMGEGWVFQDQGETRQVGKENSLRNDRKNKMRSTPAVPAAPSPAPDQRQALRLQGFALRKDFLRLPGQAHNSSTGCFEGNVCHLVGK